jgi:hypothetical protein
MRSCFVALIVGTCVLVATAACGGRTEDLASSGRPSADPTAPAEPGGGGAATTPAASELGPRPNDRDGRYAWMKTAIVGTWRGTRSNPWDMSADVVLRFDAAGGYDARCTSGDPACSVWHYGTDDLSAQGRTYELEDVATNLKGSGRIGIPFTLDGTDVVTGSIERVDIDETGRELTFDFYPTWLDRLGPVHFELQRMAP